MSIGKPIAGSVYKVMISNYHSYAGWSAQVSASIEIITYWTEGLLDKAPPLPAGERCRTIVTLLHGPRSIDVVTRWMEAITNERERERERDWLSLTSEPKIFSFCKNENETKWEKVSAAETWSRQKKVCNWLKMTKSDLLCETLSMLVEDSSKYNSFNGLILCP